MKKKTNLFLYFFWKVVNINLCKTYCDGYITAICNPTSGHCTRQSAQASVGPTCRWPRQKYGLCRPVDEAWRWPAAGRDAAGSPDPAPAPLPASATVVLSPPHCPRELCGLEHPPGHLPGTGRGSKEIRVLILKWRKPLVKKKEKKMLEREKKKKITQILFTAV